MRKWLHFFKAIPLAGMNLQSYVLVKACLISAKNVFNSLWYAETLINDAPLHGVEQAWRWTE
jgi:hypothetical protein